ncbi:Exosome complex exonuclease rrp6 [Smittium mucronatum]|uniref:Exosome complex exonuclease rrp6 n=1 Tax=Smittium mucronatum TaxID=133383 RepID=A0A1R0H9C8_9FUNG|nr:Exosome complex exonuclease rrp6 [Smittium mucronatum]
MSENRGSNVEDLVQRSFSSLMLATKRSNQIQYSELKFHSTISPDFGEVLDQTVSKTQSLLNFVCTQTLNPTPSTSTNGQLLKTKPDAENIKVTNLGDVLLPPLVQEKKPKYEMGQEYRKMIELTDSIIDRIDVNLDLIKNEKSGVLVSGPLAQSKPTVTEYKKADPSASNPEMSYNMIHATKIPRPQLNFKDEIDNSSTTNFVWKIKEKPFAQVPLEYGLPGSEIKDQSISRHLEELGLARSGSSTPIHTSGPDSQFLNLHTFDNNKMIPLPHPYEYEIKNYQPPTRYFSLPYQRKSVEWGSDTNFTFVDTPIVLDQMINELIQLKDNEGDVAIDLEHHNYRSFMGFTCLIQLSTRFKDYIIDALVLRSDLHKLNIITADPSRIKVFHGAESDIEWLQRDFGVYVVGLFDTYHATKILEYPKHSLAYLLQTIPKVSSDKKYQLADWRIRPLTSEMLNYARADTHYLLEIFDELRRQLAEVDDGLVNTINKSKITALRVFQKENYDSVYGNGPGGWNTLLSKHSIALTNRQLVVFKALHAWRDQIARLHDESIRYVLPNHLLFSIATKLPDNVQKLLSACIPTPPMVRLYSRELLELIEDSLLNVDDDQEVSISKVSENNGELSDFSVPNHLASPIYPIPRFPSYIPEKDLDGNLLDPEILDQLEIEEYKDSLEAENSELKSYTSNLFKDSMQAFSVPSDSQKETLLETMRSLSNPLLEIGKALVQGNIFTFKQEFNDEINTETPNILISDENESQIKKGTNQGTNEIPPKDVVVIENLKNENKPTSSTIAPAKKSSDDAEVDESESARMDIDELTKVNKDVLVISEIMPKSNKNKRKISEISKNDQDSFSPNIIKLDSNEDSIEKENIFPPVSKGKKSKKTKKSKKNKEPNDVSTLPKHNTDTKKTKQNSEKQTETNSPNPLVTNSINVPAKLKISKANKLKPYDPFSKTVFKSDFKTVEQNETANEDVAISTKPSKNKPGRARLPRKAKSASGNKSMTFTKGSKK